MKPSAFVSIRRGQNPVFSLWLFAFLFTLFLYLQRLKELKQREFARNVSSKSWKDEKKQKRALKRLHQLAQLKQQRDSDDRKGPKLRSTNKNKDQVKIHSAGSNKCDTKPIASLAQNSTPISTDVSLKGLSSTRIPTHQQACHEKHPLPTKSSAGHRSPRAGVSFCFSRRAQLKLDSCASVFSDGLEEASDYQELQRHRHRLALEALWSCSSSPRTQSNDDHDLSHDPTTLDWVDGDSQTPQMEAQAEHVESPEIQASYSTNEPEKLVCPDTHSPGADWKPAGSEDRLLDGGQRHRAEGAYGGSEERECLKFPGLTVYTDGQGTVTQGQLQIHKGSHHHTQKSIKQGIMQNEKDCVSEKQTEQDKLQRICKNEDTGSFLNVLSKDGSLTKWPFELVQFTSEEPRVSYSCNPLCFYFKHKKGKDKSTKAEEADLGVVDKLTGQNDRAGRQTQDVPGDKLGILKPKHRRKGKKRRCKLDVVRIQETGCAFKTCSQTQAGGRFEFQSTPTDTSQNKQACTDRRHKLGKKKRSVRDETSNESDTPEHSLKSIVVSSLSTPARKRKKCQTMRGLVSALRLVRQRPLPYSVHNTTGKADNYRWYDNIYESKRDASSTPGSDKSGSWGGLSDLTSDGEWPVYNMGRYSTSPRLNYPYPLRKEHSQPRCYIRGSYNIPHYSYSPCRDFEHTGESWDYTDSSIYNKRKYSTICNSPDRHERYSIRRHKRFLEEHKYREHRIQHTGRPLFHRVYDSPEPEEDVRDWWYERLSPVDRRHREREEFPWSSPERSEDRWYNRPVPVRSPSSSSSTSISDLSGDWMSYSHIRPSPARQSQKHCNHSEWPSERLVKTKSSHSPLRKRSHSPPLATNNHAVQLNSLQSGVVKEDATHTSTPIATDHLAEKDPKVKKANFSLSLPLIGKLPSIKKAAKKIGINKDVIANISNQAKTCSTVPSNPQIIPQIDSKTPESLQHRDEQNLSESQACLEIAKVDRSPETCASLALDPNKTLSHKHNIEDQADETKIAGIHCPKCTTPPLSEQPITFTDDEIEKYRLLQFQAQQHMQQQHLQEQASVDNMTHLPVPTPKPTDQTAISACLPYSILQPSSQSSSIAHHPSPVAILSPIHPSFSQPHFAPPIPTAFFPVPPATVLAAQPLQLIPASSLHPVHPHHHVPGLTLHPLPPTSLLPAMLSPMPMAAATAAAAAVAAASTLQIHPLLHPLFHSQDLQRHPGPTS